MQVNEENQEEFQGGAMPSLNDIISSNTELNPNQVTYQSSTKTENNQPGQTNYSYVTQTRAIESNAVGEDENNGQQTTEIKSMYNRNGGENTRYEQTTTQIKEEPDSTTKITKRVIKSEQPVTETSYYEKRVIKTTTTTTRGGAASDNQNTRYSNMTTSSIVRNNGNKYQSGTSNAYTRPSPASRGGVEKNNNLRNYGTGRTPSTNKNEQNQYSRYNVQNSQNNYSQNRGSQRPQPQKKVISSQSFAGNKYQPKRPETSTYNRQARSPDQNEIKRKTINRGNVVQNVQITHVICSSQPHDFHITENLNTESLESGPIEITQADRAKLKRTGKSSWTTSCPDNIKPIVTNLKGKTTVFQHARGIGMTNERKENINPMFYSSEIKKLDPIIKEKEKEKVEYMTFRNAGAGNSNNASNASNANNKKSNNYSNTSRNYNYNRGTNNSQQKKNYSTNTNPSYNYNTANTRGNKVSTVRTNQSYTRGGNYGSGNNGEIVKETRTKVQMGSRSQFRGSSNPTSSVTTEKRVYNSNTFFNNK